METGREVVQETFLQLCKQRPEELNGELGGWLFTVCRHRALDVLRKEKRMTLLTDSRAAEAETLPDIKGPVAISGQRIATGIREAGHGTRPATELQS